LYRGHINTMKMEYHAPIQKELLTPLVSFGLALVIDIMKEN
jgi:hypothetical protein